MVMVNVVAVPGQVSADGTTEMVAVTDVAVEFNAVNDGIVVDVPLAANPIVGSLLVQVYVVPVTPKEEPKVTKLVGALLQTA